MNASSLTSSIRHTQTTNRFQEFSETRHRRKQQQHRLRHNPVKPTEGKATGLLVTLWPALPAPSALQDNKAAANNFGEFQQLSNDFFPLFGRKLRALRVSLPRVTRAEAAPIQLPEHGCASPFPAVSPRCPPGSGTGARPRADPGDPTAQPGPSRGRREGAGAGTGTGTVTGAGTWSVWPRPPAGTRCRRPRRGLRLRT